MGTDNPANQHDPRGVHSGACVLSTQRAFAKSLRLLAAWLAVAAAPAAEVTTFVVPIPPAAIDPGGSVFEVPVPQFDPGGGGVLQQIDLTLTLDLSGQMGFENLDESLTVIYSLTLDWDVRLTRPDSSLLTQITASRMRTGLVNPFDGTDDFAGGSGVTLDVTAAGESAAFSTTDAADLSLFSGTGTVVMPLEAAFAGTASSVPEVEFDTFFAAALEGQLEVRYTWIPEPGGLWLLIGAMLGVVVRRSGR